ncbi:MAG: hypothetical protein ACXWTT_08260 [Methylobacter sp.]
MKKIKVLLDFIKLAVTEKVAFYRNIIAKLTNNPTYPTPDVSLADAKAAVDNFEAVILAARDGGHTAVSAMHDSEAATDAMFRILASYIDKTADGDETKILSSGFHESRQPVAQQKATLAVNDGSHSGSVKLIAKAIDKAGAYIWQYAKETLPAIESDWLAVATGTYSYYELSGLIVAARYYFRVAAVTSAGTTDFCAPVSKVVV